nr:uncharacterized protein LOC124818419 [Hydra vulgaris]
MVKKKKIHGYCICNSKFDFRHRIQCNTFNSLVIYKRTSRHRITKIILHISICYVHTVILLKYSDYWKNSRSHSSVIGRFLSGCCDLSSVICAEIIRSYPSSETIFQLSIQSLAFNSGFIIGPCINIFFLKIDFYIGYWHLKNFNFIGIFMTIVCLIMSFLSFLMVHNLSNAFDLKGLEEKKAKSFDITNIKLLEESILSLNNSDVIFDLNKESIEMLPLLNSTKLQISNETAGSLPHLNIFKIFKLLFLLRFLNCFFCLHHLIRRCYCLVRFLFYFFSLLLTLDSVVCYRHFKIVSFRT